VIYDAKGNEIGRFDKDGITTNSANITGGIVNIHTSNEKDSRIILRSGGWQTGMSALSIRCGYTTGDSFTAISATGLKINSDSKEYVNIGAVDSKFNGTVYIYGSSEIKIGISAIF